MFVWARVSLTGPVLLVGCDLIGASSNCFKFASSECILFLFFFIWSQWHLFCHNHVPLWPLVISDVFDIMDIWFNPFPLPHREHILQVQSGLNEYNAFRWLVYTHISESLINIFILSIFDVKYSLVFTAESECFLTSLRPVLDTNLNTSSCYLFKCDI